MCITVSLSLRMLAAGIDRAQNPVSPPAGIQHLTKLILKHLKISDLPSAWAERLKADPGQLVTVRIEAETDEYLLQAAGTVQTDDPAFGIWRDHEDIADVETYARD